VAAKRKKASGKKPRRGTAGKAGRASAAPERRPHAGRSVVRWWPWAALLALVGGVILWQAYPTGRTVPQGLRLEVVATHPHARDAFTQGLLVHEGKLYESTGLRGRSTLREVDIESGEVLRKVELDDEHFAEGLARVGDELVQLTWQSGKAFRYRIADFELVGEHDYTGEGWGLCFDGERLVMSDGTAWLSFRDPQTFERIGEVRVTRAGRPLRRLNELECVDGQVFANVWTDEHIARIDPETGEVLPDGELGELVFTSLTKEAFPIIRYRTRDLTRLRPGTARSVRRMDKVTGRSDDMIILRGVNVFPTQIEECLMQVAGLAPHFQIELSRPDRMDQMKVLCEVADASVDRASAERDLSARVKQTVGISVKVVVHEMGSVARSEGKAVRIVDNRPKT